MDARTFRDTVIKPKLTELFGAMMTNLLMTRAISAGMKGSDERAKLQLMVETICSDQKVVGMWGAAQAQKQKQAWLSAFS